MKFRKSFKLALNILLHSRLRSWLTIIGIVIGVAAMVAIVSIGEGAQANVQSSLSGLGADIITVSSGGGRAIGGFRGEGGGGGGATSTKAKNLTTKDIQAVKSVPGVLYVEGIVAGRGSMVYLAETASVSIQGVDTLTWHNIVTTQLDSGRYLEPSDINDNVIVIGSRIAASTFKQPLGLNMAVNIHTDSDPAGRTFKIVGILQASGGFGGDDNTVFMPINAGRALLNKGPTNVDQIVIKAESSGMVSQVTNDTDLRLMLARHLTPKTKDYSVTSAQAIQQRVASVTQTFTVFLAAIAAVSLLVGAVGIANTMFTSVLEKTREIGIMKAIGAKNIDILMIFLLNSALVGLTGGLIGIVLGSIISAYIPGLFSGIGGPIGGRGGFKTVIPASLLVAAIVVSVSIGMIAGVIPAYRASKLKPVDALRSE